MKPYCKTVFLPEFSNPDWLFKCPDLPDRKRVAGEDD
jgi:hypothetical protein